eukprot:gene27400-20772_t
MLSVGVFLALHASTSAGSTWHTRQAVLYRYESSCVHAPVSQAVVGSFDVMTNANNAAGRLFSINSNSNSNDDEVSRMILPEEVVSTPRPEHCLADADLPNMWDWRNVTIARGAPAIDFTTRIRNQFLPFWCGSCWAHAATAVLGSRWRIHGAGAVDFSVQYFVNCASEPFPGRGNTGCRGCNGGSSYGAY